MDKVMTNAVKKLEKGLYETSNGFLVRYEKDLEGQLKWVVYHNDDDVTTNYEDEGYDQLFVSKSEAVDYVSDININDLVY